MKRLERFLSKQIPAGELFHALKLYFWLSMMLTIFGFLGVKTFLSIFGLTHSAIAQGLSSETYKPTGSITFHDVWIMVFLGPILEEFIFRGPLYLVMRATSSKRIVSVAMVCSTVIFGYVHGNICNVFIQGVAGFFFGAIFLKAGGMKCRFCRALFASFSLHAAYNAACVTILAFNG